MIALWLVLVLRYGQGTDYFSYNYLFERFSDLKGAIYNTINEHGEIGFRVLCAVFPWSFKWFVAIISTFEMLMLDRFIRRYSKNAIMSLLLFYPTYYLTYYFSILRQGIIIALFIGCLLEWIETKKWVRYYVVSVLAITIHSSAAVLLIIPLIRYLRMKWILLIDACCGVAGIVMSTSFGVAMLNRIPQVNEYTSAEVSVIALLERVLMLAVLLLLYFYRKKYMEDTWFVYLIKVYTVGIGVYLFFLAFPLLSARFMALFKVLEIVIIPTLLVGRSKYREFIIVFLLLITAAMTYKNLDSYVKQGDYYEYVKPYNYPYITIFDQERLWDYREESIYQPFLKQIR